MGFQVELNEGKVKEHRKGNDSLQKITEVAVWKRDWKRE